MGNSEIDAKKIPQETKSEYQDVERELYIAPVDIYDSSDEDIEDGTIEQTGDSSFEISLSKDVVAEEKENKDSKHPVLDKVHGFLDVVGFIPVLGAAPDVANGILYLCQGDFVNMTMSFIAAIPGYGDAIAGVAKGAKYAAKGAKYVKTSKLARIESNHVTEQAMFIIRMAKGQQTKNVSLLWTNGTKMNAHKVVEKVQSLAPELNIKMLETTSRGIKMESIVNKELVKFAREETKMTQHEIKNALSDGSLWSKLEANPKFDKVIEGERVNKELVKFANKETKMTPHEIRQALDDGTLVKKLEANPKFAKFKVERKLSFKSRLQKFQADVSKNYAKKSSDDVIVEFYDKSMGQLKNSQRSLIPGPANKAEINLLRKLRKILGRRSIDGVIGVDPIK